MSRRTAYSDRKRWLIASILINFLLLCFFKYSNFFISNFNTLNSLLHIHSRIPGIELAVPLGVSFIVFRKISYSIDYYRNGNDRNVPQGLKYVCLYSMFFPQVISGPIERSSNFFKQIDQEHRFVFSDIAEGGRIVFWGLFKKLVVADGLDPIVRAAFDNGSVYGFTWLIAMWSFALQLYADFSGYTDIAIGTARCFGIRSSINFNLPYFAINPSDFWRRWHISLSSWFRDYVYIPLGGNRVSLPKEVSNVVTTMMLCGLWHGASWTFVLWGLYHGLLLSLQKIIKALRGKKKAFSGWLLRRWFDIFITFNLVCLGWILFRSNSLAGAIEAYKALFTFYDSGITDLTFVAKFLFYGSCLSAVDLFMNNLSPTSRKDKSADSTASVILVGKTIVYAGAFYLMFLYGIESRSFIYARF